MDRTQLEYLSSDSPQISSRQLIQLRLSDHNAPPFRNKASKRNCFRLWRKGAECIIWTILPEATAIHALTVQSHLKLKTAELRRHPAGDRQVVDFQSRSQLRQILKPWYRNFTTTALKSYSICQIIFIKQRGRRVCREGEVKCFCSQAITIMLDEG